MSSLPNPARRASFHPRWACLRPRRKHAADLFGRRLLRSRAAVLTLMTSSTPTVTVTVLAAPSVPCYGKMTWETATAMIRDRFAQRFGSQVSVDYVELFSPESFAFPAVLEGIQREEYCLPVVLVDGSVVSNGAKLNEGLIARNIREHLQRNGQ